MMSKTFTKEILSRHTSLKIGGPAPYFLEADSLGDILEAISIAEDRGKELLIIGKGTNILIDDRGFDGVIVKLGRDFDHIKIEDGNVLNIGGAFSIAALVQEAARKNLSGCEFLAGIPGSFGGAIYMNAGVRDIYNPAAYKEVKDIVIDVDVLDLGDKKKKRVDKKEIGFSYRSSGLSNKCILGARVSLAKDKRIEINNRIKAFLRPRSWLRDLGHASAGSIFKNPDSGWPAGKLIEMCGLKGKAIGGAEISRFHANFIVNKGGATSKDIMGLIDLARTSVKDRFGVDLELELKVA